MKLRFCPIALTFALLLTISTNMRGQSATAGAIGGIVTDAQHAVVSGAEVTTHNTATNATSAAKSDQNGRYIVNNLPPGNYTVDISTTGFSPFKADVIVEVGLATPVDAQLAVAGQLQTVIVTGEAPVVNTEENVFANNFNQASMGNLPINGRRWSTYALATPRRRARRNFRLRELPRDQRASQQQYRGWRGQ